MMLEANRRRVQQLTGREIWLFAIGRTLMAFGAGLMLMKVFPEVMSPLAWPAIMVGVVVFLIACRGLWRAGSTPPAA